MERWETAVYELLCTALALSDRVVIVTNSRSPWVTDCVERFAPRLKPLFDRNDVGAPKVVYARDVYAEGQRKTPGMTPAKYTDECPTADEKEEQLTAWKYAAMKKETESFYSRHPRQTWKNILSFGDKRYEHHAVQDVVFRREGPARESVRTKSYILPEEMSISWMTMAWQYGRIFFPIYVRFDGDFTLDESDRPSLHRMDLNAQVFNMPELLELQFPEEVNSGSGADRCPTQEDSSCLATALDELTLVVQEALEY